jgi:hypothetical protein
LFYLFRNKGSGFGSNFKSIRKFARPLRLHNINQACLLGCLLVAKEDYYVKFY